MTAQVAALYRHPIKGFTPEALSQVDLAIGRGFPNDRIFVVENGPSGFDPDRPAYVPKQKFAVLMALPQVAAARTRYDDATGMMDARAPGRPPFAGCLDGEAGRAAFSAWLTGLLGEHAKGPLRLVKAPPGYRFTDHPQGEISIVNLASIRDLSRRCGTELDPLRFRANIYVDGWPAWAELRWPGEVLRLGACSVEVYKPIVRCAAINVHPDEACRDLDLTKALFDNFGHMHCGIYGWLRTNGRITVGDAVSQPAAAPIHEDAL